MKLLAFESSAGPASVCLAEDGKIVTYCKACGKYDNFLTRIISAPGMWVQRLTTKEPEDDMIEVAITAFTTVLQMDENANIPTKKGIDIANSVISTKTAAATIGVDKRNENPFYKELENELLEKINELDIGPQGFGGITTAFAVNIETAPTHIAGLPVSVNIGCHVTRHITQTV